ncbi:MAG: type II toxin-antitoxin system RelE/ParE family toxin [bacterium]|nr:type II toxin-antitoxin system RelE/ParE family toxin [bacterium]
MVYKVILEKRARKELNKIPKIDQIKIIRVFYAISKNPFSGKKLSGELLGLYAIRVWPYRVIYEIRKKELYVSVVHVGHRQGVY